MTSRAIASLISTLLFCGTALADPVTFTFTGTGIHGAQASGSFTTEGGPLAPGYFAQGSIYSGFALTITDIPGSGPSSVTFGIDDLPFTWLKVDLSGNIFIAPYGSHGFGAPSYYHYDLGQPSQPGWPGSDAFETILYFDGEHGYRDTMTWSAATPASSTSAVPETGSTLAMLMGTAMLLGAGSYRRRRAR